MIKRESTKQDILKESAFLFRQKGYHASTLRSIAKLSGIKGGSVYHHFESKQMILYRIMDDTLKDLTFYVQEGTEGDAPPLIKLRKALYCHTRYHLDHFDDTYVTDTEFRSLEGSNIGAIKSRRKDYEAIFIEILKAAVADGEVAVRNVKLVAFAFLQMCTGLSLWFNDGGELTLEEMVDEYCDVIICGIQIPKGLATAAAS